MNRCCCSSQKAVILTWSFCSTRLDSASDTRCVSEWSQNKPSHYRSGTQTDRIYINYALHMKGSWNGSAFVNGRDPTCLFFSVCSLLTWWWGVTRRHNRKIFIESAQNCPCPQLLSSFFPRLLFYPGIYKRGCNGIKVVSFLTVVRGAPECLARRNMRGNYHPIWPWNSLWHLSRRMERPTNERTTTEEPILEL